MKPALIWSTLGSILGIAAWLSVRAGRARQAKLDENFEKALAQFSAFGRRFRERKRHHVLTLDVLERIPDDDLVQAIVDWGGCRTERAESAGASSAVAWQALPEAFRIICATSYAAAQVSTSAHSGSASFATDPSSFSANVTQTSVANCQQSANVRHSYDGGHVKDRVSI